MEIATHVSVFALFTLIQNVRSSERDALDMTELLFALSDETSDSEDVKSNKEIAAYKKYLSKLEQKYYKEKFRKEISDEEKSEVKYFENLLDKVSMINKNFPQVE